MRLYGEDRVLEAEAGPEVARRIARTLAARRARKALQEAFEARLAELARRIPVEVPRLERRRLAEEAKALLAPPGQRGLFGDEGMEAACVARSWPGRASGCCGRSTSSTADPVCGRRGWFFDGASYKAIAEAYSDLARECARRMEAECGGP